MAREWLIAIYAVLQGAATARSADVEIRPWAPRLSAARRLRVMQVVPTLDPGGTERLVIEIVKALSHAVDSTVCCLDRPGSWARELTDHGVEVVALGRRAGFHPGLGRHIAQLAEQHRIDVLHCHHYSPFIYGQLAGLLNRRLRVVFTEHGRLSDAGPSLKRRLVNPFFGRMAEAIYAVSDDLRQHMIAEGLPGSRVRVIHNGISPGPRPTAAQRAAARASLGIDGAALVLGAAGRLDPVKDIPTLLQAFGAVRQTWPDARLVVMGDGPERHNLQQRIGRMLDAASIILTGYRSDVRELLAAVDVFVNSSTHEGVSLTILEAMAAVIPVVATRVGGTPEVVLDGETGLLVAPRAPQALASAVETLACAPALRRSMGDAGRFRVKRHFRVEAMVDSYLNAYRGHANAI